MAFANPNSPNLPDFLTYIGDTLNPSVQVLPADSPWPGYAFDEAKIIVQCAIGAGVIYSLAVYNLGVCLLIGITPDQTGQTYFGTLRHNYKVGLPSTGLLQATSDVTTSVSQIAPGWATGLTPDQLGLYNIPYGQQYLSYALKYGANVVNIS